MQVYVAAIFYARQFDEGVRFAVVLSLAVGGQGILRFGVIGRRGVCFFGGCILRGGRQERAAQLGPGVAEEYRPGVFTDFQRDAFFVLEAHGCSRFGDYPRAVVYEVSDAKLYFASVGLYPVCFSLRLCHDLFCHVGLPLSNVL
ncbi:hypothetical protein SDC9_119840 [bioreactor metagenome]|uniref:Uncharacterized protein n=1 Tax=bioreactor metagenome TaxID=1076179 RepID=A0A645C9K0_9ZZZZ